MLGIRSLDSPVLLLFPLATAEVGAPCPVCFPLYSMWAPEQKQELDGAQGGGAQVPVLWGEGQANKTMDNFFTWHAVKLEINVTKELQIPYVFHKGEKDQTNTWREYPFSHFLNSKIISLLYVISQLRVARNWDGTEEKYDCILDLSPYA